MIAFFDVNGFFSIFDKIQERLLKNAYYIILLLFITFFACTKKNGAIQTDTTSEDSLSIYLLKANDFNSPQNTR